MSASHANSRGAAAVLLLFAVAFGGAGLALDIFFNHQRAFWIGAEPGARALIGAGVGAFVAAIGHVLRLFLARRG